jgi:S1-C subfamily serine protease
VDLTDKLPAVETSVDGPAAPFRELPAASSELRHAREIEMRQAHGSQQLGWLLIVLVVLALLWMGKYIVGQYQYHATLGQLQAEVEAATTGLSELRPRLDDLMAASRLVAKRVGPSVVSIHRSDFQGGEGQGSGVIVDPQGYIVTNTHVVDGATGLHVRLEDGRFADASVIGADSSTDIAVLKIDLPDLMAAEWGDSDELQVGDLVWAVGSPFGLDRSITFGIVSAKARRTGSGIPGSPYQEYLQTDVAVNPGNSGGPLVDLTGKVVGINTAIVGPSYRGISFAIPTSLARDTYERLLKDGWIERGYLGIRPEPVPDGIRDAYGLEFGQGVLVYRVSPPNGPAARAGIRRGDVILRWNDHEATDPTLLSRAIASTEIGSEATVVVKRLQRDGEAVERTFKAIVGRSPLSVRPE